MGREGALLYSVDRLTFMLWGERVPGVVLRLAEILSRDDLVIKVSNKETHHIVANINKLNSVIGEVPFSEIDKFLSEVILNDE